MPDRLTARVHLGFSRSNTKPHLLICRETPRGHNEIISSRVLVDDDDEVAAGLPAEDGLPGLRHDPDEPPDVVSFVAAEGGDPGVESLLLDLSEMVLDARGYTLVGDWWESPHDEVFYARIAEKGQVVDDSLQAVTILGDTDGGAVWPCTELHRVWEGEIVGVVAASSISVPRCWPLVPAYYTDGPNRSPAWQEAEEESDRFLAALGYRRVGTWEPTDLGSATAPFVERMDGR